MIVPKNAERIHDIRPRLLNFAALNPNTRKYMRLLPLASLGLLLCASACGGNSTAADANAEAATDSTAAVHGVIVPAADTLDLTAYDGKTVVMDFNAVWCPPCRQYGPIFHEVAEAAPADESFLSIDVDSFPRISTEYVGQYIPQTTIISADRQHRVDTVGCLTAETLRTLVDSVKAL